MSNKIIFYTCINVSKVVLKTAYVLKNMLIDKIKLVIE